MPLPVGHSLISLGIYAAYRRDGLSLNTMRSGWKTALLFVFAGLLPDVDFVTVPFLGFGSHRGFTHSFFFAFIASSFLYTFVKAIDPGTPKRLWPFLLLASSLHPVCDFFTYDYLVERGGVMLFYPLSRSYIQSPFPVFMGIELRYLDTVLSLHTVLALLYETVLSTVFLLTVLHLKNRLLRTAVGVAERRAYGKKIED